MVRTWFLVVLSVLVCAHAVRADVPGDRLNDFVNFLNAQGFEFPQDKLAVVAIPGAGYGVRAVGHIEAGDTLVNVSRNALLTTRKYLHDRYPWGKDVEATFPPHLDSGIVACGFMVAVDELDPASVFQPYYRLLPRSFSVPEYWTEADVDGLAFFTTLREERIAFYKGVWEKSTELRAKYAETFSRVSFDQLKWGIAICRTRSWSDGGAAGVLVPLADLFNHDCTGRAGNVRDDHFSLSSGRTYEAGDEIFDNYGGKSSLALLSGYGFNPEDNACDQILGNGVRFDRNFGLSPWSTNVRKSLFTEMEWAQEGELTGNQMYFAKTGAISPNMLRWERMAAVPGVELGYVRQHVEKARAENPGALKSMLVGSDEFWTYESELIALRRISHLVSLHTQHNLLGVTEKELDAWSAARPNKTFVQQMIERTARNMLDFHSQTKTMMKNLWRAKLTQTIAPMGEQYVVSAY